MDVSRTAQGSCWKSLEALDRGCDDDDCRDQVADEAPLEARDRRVQFGLEVGFRHQVGVRAAAGLDDGLGVLRLDAGSLKVPDRGMGIDCDRHEYVLLAEVPQMASWRSGGGRQVAERGEQDSAGDGRDGRDAERQPLFGLCESRPQVGFGDGLRVGAGDGFDDCLGPLGVASRGREPLDGRMRVESDAHGHILPVANWGAGRGKAIDVADDPGARQLADLVACGGCRAVKGGDRGYPNFERAPGSFYRRRQRTALDGLTVWPDRAPLRAPATEAWDSYHHDNKQPGSPEEAPWRPLPPGKTPLASCICIRFRRRGPPPGNIRARIGPWGGIRCIRPGAGSNPAAFLAHRGVPPSDPVA